MVLKAKATNSDGVGAEVPTVLGSGTPSLLFAVTFVEETPARGNMHKKRYPNDPQEKDKVTPADLGEYLIEVYQEVRTAAGKGTH